ncbi:hypothetical protein FSARC_8356 [Fusarium sarcochroum]|uniref:MARVEL domain-containing protein n=1 Tax=Fusarium sarcochroum TaxID=1208366 RepID=A0A8H4TT26_9HYPO|nr:hypothetical protein FSARC_8356 [Fusarium sarcochroum]
MEQPQEKPEANHVLKTPLWIIIIRGFQFLVSLIIVGLCARMIHDAYLDEQGLSLAIAIITWVVVAYTVFTEKIPSLRSAYHIIAVLALDGLLIILWLAAWTATAARRAKYVVPVSVGDCIDDGSLTDSKTCSIFKRDGENVVLFKTGLAMFSAIAGLGALVWILFIVTFVWTLVMFLRGRKEGRFAVNTSGVTTPSNNYQMENKVPEVQVAQPQQHQGAPQQYQQQPAPGQFVPQQQQQQQQYPPQNAPAPYQQAQSPYQQQGAYPPPQAAPYSPQEQQQFQGQQNYGQYPPQQQQHQQPPQPYGSELSAPTPQPYGSELSAQTPYSTPPPPATVSPPPHQQPYPPQAYPQQ